MSRDDRRVLVAFAAAALLVALAASALAGIRQSREAPSAGFCMAARAAVAVAGSEAAAEAAARERGISDETITKARRCKR